jgi:tetratricopeptide (TPR) repeat protein
VIQSAEKMSLRLPCLGIALISLIVYLPVRLDSFLPFDDPTYITNNRVVQAGLTWHGLVWAFTTTAASNWHPLTWLSHMLDCQLFGTEPGAQHLVSALLHAANASILLLLFVRLTNSPWPSAIAAALLAWHPLRVESVAWVSERKDVLSVFFFLVTLLAYVAYVRHTAGSRQPSAKESPARQRLKQPPGQSRGKDALRFYLLALFLFALGLMCKPMLVTTPFVLLLLDYWPLRRFDPVGSLFGLRKLVWEKMPFFVLALVSSGGTYLAQREIAVVPLGDYSVPLRLANTVLGYGSYLLKTICPIDLAIIYPFPRYLPWTRLVSSGIALILISWFCWQTRRKRPHLLVGWLWFLGTLVPVIGLVQVGGAAFADRYTYIPHIGLFLAIAIEAQYWSHRWQFKPAFVGSAASFVLVACLVLTVHQLQFWRDGISLFTHAIEVTSENPMAQLNLGLSLEVKGADRQALHHYEEALRLNPQLQEAHNALGDLLNELGKTNEAIAQYTAALRLIEQPVTHENLGVLLVKTGRIDEAISHYQAAAKLDPTDPRAPYLMAKALLRQGHDAEAVTQFREALRRDPNYLQALVYFARVLAADRDPHIRDGAEATLLAERANAMTGGTQSFMLDTLAMAYAETGRFTEAQHALQQAVERSTVAGETEAVLAMQERLKLYEFGHPYREDFMATGEGSKL